MAYFSFLYSQLFVEVPIPGHDFTGQTVIVTGANRGLGLEAARHLLSLNASKVILGVRSKPSGLAAKQDLETSTGRDNAIQVLELDMSTCESVNAFSAQIQAFSRLDAVILNAGICTEGFSLADGYESTITINVINTFLLALLLLPVLRKSASKWNIVPRMSIVSSDRHVMTNLPEWRAQNTFEQLTNSKSPTAHRYFASKLMQILLARAMAERVLGPKGMPDVIINTLTPGYCISNLTNDARGLTAAFLWLLTKTMARTTEAGARSLIAAISKGTESHGKYVNDGQVDESSLSPFVRSAEGHEAQEKIWRELLVILRQKSFTFDI